MLTHQRRNRALDSRALLHPLSKTGRLLLLAARLEDLIVGVEEQRAALLTGSTLGAGWTSVTLLAEAHMDALLGRLLARMPANGKATVGTGYLFLLPVNLKILLPVACGLVTRLRQRRSQQVDASFLAGGNVLTADVARIDDLFLGSHALTAEPLLNPGHGLAIPGVGRYYLHVRHKGVARLGFHGFRDLQLVAYPLLIPLLRPARLLVVRRRYDVLPLPALPGTQPHLPSTFCSSWRPGECLFPDRA